MAEISKFYSYIKSYVNIFKAHTECSESYWNPEYFPIFCREFKWAIIKISLFYKAQSTKTQFVQGLSRECGEEKKKILRVIMLTYKSSYQRIVKEIYCVILINKGK